MCTYTHASWQSYNIHRSGGNYFKNKTSLLLVACTESDVFLIMYLTLKISVQVSLCSEIATDLRENINNCVIIIPCVRSIHEKK